MRPSDTEATAGAGVNRLAGIVEDIAYLGGVSIYRVRVEAANAGRDGEPSSQIVEMTMTNVQPRTEQDLTWGQHVAMEWSPTSGVLLTE
jgi:putrescine transport system ATP-binding protein